MAGKGATDGIERRHLVYRVAALGRFTLGRLWRQARYTAPGQLLTTVAIVALAVTLLLSVTGISLQLAAEPAVGSEEADLRITTAEGMPASPAITVEAPRLGEVHDHARSIEAHDNVVSATPVLVEIVQIRTPESGEPVTVLAIGLIPGPNSPTVAGVSPRTLESGDPYYANGTYDGEYTGDTLLSTGAADALNASIDDPILLQSTQSWAVTDEHSVTAINPPATPEADGLPIAIFRLSELQAVSGAADGDLATQILVQTDGNDEQVRSHITSTIPDAHIVADGGLGADFESLQEDDLALAVSVAAALIGISLCVLFVATTMGIAIDGDRHMLALFGALGFSERTRLGIVSFMILAVTSAGATVGLVIGTVGVVLANRIAQATVTTTPVATVGLWAVPYAYGIAVIAALLALPYPLWIAKRTSVNTELGR